MTTFESLLSAHLESRGGVQSPPPEAEQTLSPNTPRELRIGDTFRLLRVQDVDSKWENEHQLRIEDLFPILDSATANLRQATIDGVKAANTALEIINTQRYKRKLPWLREKATELEEAHIAKALADLTKALEEYVDNTRMEILEPYRDIIESPFQIDKHGRPPFSIRPLFLCFVFQSNLIWTAEAVKALLALLNEAQKKRPEGRLWWPSGLSKLWGVLSPDGGPSPLDADLPPPLPDSDDKQSEEYFGVGHRE